jgi:hypothetical protein
VGAPIPWVANERRLRFTGANLILGIERRHPDHAAPPAVHAGHVVDGVRVHAANRQVEIDAAEHLDARHRLAREEREAGRRIEVALQHDRAHPFVFRKPRRFEAIERPRHVVRIGVHVNVDGAAQVALDVRTCSLRNRLTRPDGNDGKRHGACNRNEFHAKRHASTPFSSQLSAVSYQNLSAESY